MKGREAGISEGQMGIQSDSEEQRNHKAERPGHQKKSKAKE